MWFSNYLLSRSCTLSSRDFRIFSGLTLSIRHSKTSSVREPIIGLGRAVLPWFDLNLGWVIPAALGLVIGLLLRKKAS